MASQLGLYNAALLHLGDRTLESLTEDREARRVLDSIWGNEFVERVLVAGQWKFAARTVKLTSCANVSPEFGYTYAFQKPPDLVRLLGFSSEETASIPENQYVDENQFWFTNIDPVYVSYVSSLATHGSNLGIWPEAVTTFAEYDLASRAAMRITGNEKLWRDMVSLREAALLKAQSLDAMEGPTRFLQPGNWTRARFGSRRRDYGSRSKLIG